MRDRAEERFSEGASGSFLYFSKDGGYIVKTISAGDMRSLRRTLSACVCVDN